MTDKQKTSYLTRTVKLLILLILFNGLIDSIYFVLLYAKHSFQSETAIKGAAKDFYLGQANKHYAPGIGMLDGPVTSSEVNISSDSRRLSTQTSVNNSHARGILLGASQAFGYGVKDNQTLSSALNNILKNSEIVNYASIGQRITSNTVFWHSLMERGEKFDFAMMLNIVDLYYYCNSEPDKALNSTPLDYSNYPRLALIVFKLYDKLRKINTTSDSTASSVCKANSTGVDDAVFRVLYDINAAISFAKENKIPFIYIIPPNPYHSEVNVSNLEVDPNFHELQLKMAPVQAALTKRLKETPIPGVLDLSNAFDDGGQYFLDSAGHFSALGNGVLAHKIVDRLGPQFFK